MFAKVILLGTWLVSFGTIMYLWFTVYRRLPAQSAVDVRIFSGSTIHNPVWWVGVVACFAVAFTVVRGWPGKPALWVFLAVTELIPVGMLTLFLVMVSRLRQAAGR